MCLFEAVTSSARAAIFGASSTDSQRIACFFPCVGPGWLGVGLWQPMWSTLSDTPGIPSLQSTDIASVSGRVRLWKRDGETLADEKKNRPRQAAMKHPEMSFSRRGR